MEILVYLQIDKNGICDFSYDLISYAREILKEGTVSGAIVLPEGGQIDLTLLKKYGLNKLYILKTDLPYYDKRCHPYFLIELLRKKDPDIFILNSTTEGREIAPVVASTLNTGLTADCTKLEITEGKLVSTRPTFGGKLMASILCKRRPEMATVRVNTFKKKELEEKEFQIEEFCFTPPNLKTEILNFEEDKGKEFTNLQNAKIILAGGVGLKTKENFEKLKLLAEKLGAKVAGTRKAVDFGLIEREFQIGQTGQTVAPEVYVAFGVSGAIHHIVGMENSKKIIAINTDKNAPIFNHADIGIIMDANKAIDLLSD